MQVIITNCANLLSTFRLHVIKEGCFGTYIKWKGVLFISVKCVTVAKLWLQHKYNSCQLEFMFRFLTFFIFPFFFFVFCYLFFSNMKNKLKLYFKHKLNRLVYGNTELSGTWVQILEWCTLSFFAILVTPKNIFMVYFYLKCRNVI